MSNDVFVKLVRDFVHIHSLYLESVIEKSKVNDSLKNGLVESSKVLFYYLFTESEYSGDIKEGVDYFCAIKMNVEHYLDSINRFVDYIDELPRI